MPDWGPIVPRVRPGIVGLAGDINEEMLCFEAEGAGRAEAV